MEQSNIKRVQGKDLGLEFITEGETFSYIKAFCLASVVESGGRTRALHIDLSDTTVLVLGECKEFWELLRCRALCKLTLRVEDSLKQAVEMVGLSVGVNELVKNKITFLTKGLFSETERESNFASLTRIDSDKVHIICEEMFVGVLLNSSDMMKLSTLVDFIKETYPEKKIVIDLREYILTGVLTDIIPYVSDVQVMLSVPCSSARDIFNLVAKNAEYLGGENYLEEATKKYEGKRGCLNYTNMKQRGYNLPAKLTKVFGGTATFEVFGPKGTESGEYKYFTVSVPIHELSIDASTKVKDDKFRFITEDIIKNDIILQSVRDLFE